MMDDEFIPFYQMISFFFNVANLHQKSVVKSVYSVFPVGQFSPNNN